MIQILIVDDEPIELDALNLMISRNFSGSVKIFKTINGYEAIKIVKEISIDIVILDILMPGMDGIETAEILKSIKSNIRVIFLTAYNYFDYAQKAIQVGTEGFLLKPVKQKELVNKIAQIINVIETERDNYKKYAEIIDKLEILKPKIEKELINAIISGSFDIDAAKEYLDIIGQDFSNSFCVVIEKSKRKNGFKEELVELLNQYTVINYTQEVFIGSCKSVLSEYLQGKLVIFASLKTLNNETEGINKIIKICERIRHYVHFNQNINLVFGIGKVYLEISQLTLSYNEALRAIKQTNDEEPIIYFGDVLAINSVKKPSHNKEKSLIEKIMVGNFQESSKQINGIFNEIYEIYTGNIEGMRSSIISLVCTIERNMDEGFDLQGKDLSLLISELITVKSISQFNDWLINYIKTLCDCINQVRKKSKGILLYKIKEYINNNYCSNLSLEEVASQFGITSYYLCRIFKKTVGLSFVEYVNELRIKKAIEMIKNTTLSIKEISHEVGFNSPAYFSKVFRKMMGESATTFKKV